MGPKQVLPHWVRMKRGLMIMKGTPHSQELQNWSLTFRCSLVSYPGHSFFWGGILPLCRGYSQRILSPRRGQNSILVFQYSAMKILIYSFINAQLKIEFFIRATQTIKKSWSYFSKIVSYVHLFFFQNFHRHRPNQRKNLNHSDRFLFCSLFLNTKQNTLWSLIFS